jgi:hypothetical protein
MELPPGFFTDFPRIHVEKLEKSAIRRLDLCGWRNFPPPSCCVGLRHAWLFLTVTWRYSIRPQKVPCRGCLLLYRELALYFIYVISMGQPTSRRRRRFALLLLHQQLVCKCKDKNSLKLLPTIGHILMCISTAVMGPICLIVTGTPLPLPLLLHR